MDAIGQRIVAATDFSTDAGNAVRRAALLASMHGSQLEVLHVVDKSSLDAVRAWIRTPADAAERVVDDARHLLDESVAALGTPAAARLAIGVVLGEIMSDCSDASMLVVGAHGLNPLRDAILGTTAERLVTRSRCPILVVRNPAQTEYRRVLVPVDLLPGSEKALAAAAWIAPSAKLSAAHAYDVPFEGALQRAGVSTIEIDRYRAEAFHKAVDAIGRLSEQVTGESGRFLPMVDRGDAARFIMDCEQALGADLVVIGGRRRSAAEALLLGRVTRHVLADAKADVLVLQEA